MDSDTLLYTKGFFPSLELFGLSVPIYFTWISFVTCLCILWLFKRAERLRLPQVKALDAAFFALVFGFIGARAFHIIFEIPKFYLENPSQIFRVWQGGFVFYGGLIFGYLGGLWSLKRKSSEPLLTWHDCFAPILAGGYALGRMACFFQGCCYGKVCDLPWALPITEIHSNGAFLESLRHPTALYAIFWELAVLFVLIYKDKKWSQQKGRLFFTWLGLHGLGRILMEFFRGDPRGLEPMGLMSLSSFISLFLIGFSVYFLFTRGDVLRKASDRAS